MKTKASTPKGTRDFAPQQMVKRNYIFDTCRTVFQQHGYQPIETPAMENLETLMGKYGEEGDRLIFKILKRGESLNKGLERVKAGETGMSLLADQALRYDLTVPFARYVVQYRNDISFPFKRYQIQPVWRADRPQKGRYREFFQCDVDVIGSNSLLNEVELVSIVDKVFAKLKLPEVNIQLNNRKILTGMAEIIGEPDKIIDITVAIDKLDKIGLEKVNEEMLAKGVSESAVQQLQPIIELAGTNAEKMEKMRSILASSETGIKGIDELDFIFSQCEKMGIQNVTFNLTLARGLNYYTGAIFEVTHPDFKSSITGGGRYDDLTGIFGLPDTSGVGVSFGADRIYDLLEEKNLYPETVSAGTDVMFANFGDNEAAFCLPLANQLHKKGVSAEVYPDSAKLKKQFKYANDKGIRFLVMAGTTEIESGKLTVKNMATGEQLEFATDQLATEIAQLVF